MEGQAKISQNNLKTCCECGRRIPKGGLCLNIQEAAYGGHDGSRHVCESCMSLLAQGLETDIRGFRLSAGPVSRSCSCFRCKEEIPKDSRAAAVRIRPPSKGSPDRTRKLCMGCLQDIKQELRVFRIGMDAYEAPRYVSSRSEYLRTASLNRLEGT